MRESSGTAIVTGASSGIGAVYADRLAARGHDLVLVARRRDRLEALAASLSARHGRRIEVVAADLADPDDVARVETAIADTPALAAIVNAAGLGALGPAAQTDPDQVDRMLRVTILALTRLSQAAARRFAAAGRGTIVNIGSVIAVMPVPGAGAYSGSKAYVLNFSRALQAELGNQGIIVQAVMPGPVRSEFFGDRPAPFPDALFMSAETLVDTALTALDQGETVTFPNLADGNAWQRFEVARTELVGGVTQSGAPAPRYAERTHSAAA